MTDSSVATDTVGLVVSMVMFLTSLTTLLPASSFAESLML